MNESRRDEKFPTAADARGAADAARGNTRPSEVGLTVPRAATRRTVGVYDRPARRARLSLPLLVILILSALVSVVVAARFLF
ncbi:MAG TPA: hypothetical protein VGB05_07150 [Pyrinomonadaceae bacterium]